MDSRAEFEKWATGNHRVGNLIGLERSKDGYVAEVLDADWTVWQASRNAALELAAEVVTDYFANDDCTEKTDLRDAILALKKES